MQTHKNGKPVIRLYKGQHGGIFAFRKTTSGILQVCHLAGTKRSSWSNVELQTGPAYEKMLEITGERK